MPKDIINEINKILYNFLWNNKNEKIKRNTLIGSKFCGGIDMIDISSYITSLKIKWVKAFINKPKANWAVIPKTLFHNYGPDFLIFRTNLHNIKLVETKHLTDFYKDLLQTWIQFKNTFDNKRPTTFSEIRKEIIWNNKYIKNRGKSLCFKSWIKSGIIFINDIIDKSGIMKDDIILNKLICKKNWIAEVSLIKKSIPADWKQILHCEASNQTKIKTTLDIMIQNQNLSNISNKTIYNHLVSKKFSKPFIHQYWETKLNKSIQWKQFYIFLNSLHDNRIKQFKFKLLYNIFPCKANRFKWKMTDSPNCTLCNTSETYEHVFIDCSEVTNVWQFIDEYFKSCGINKSMKKIETIVLGYKYAERDYLYYSYLNSEDRNKQVNIIESFKSEIKFLNLFSQHQSINNFFIKKLERLI